jgi:hypothetical protein
MNHNDVYEICIEGGPCVNDLRQLISEFTL